MGLKTFFQKHWGKVAIGSAALAALVITLRRRQADISSGIDGDYKVMQFTLNNTTDLPQTVQLFNSRQINGIGNPAVGITPAIDNFNNSLSSEPKKVLQIQIRTKDQTQAEAVINKMCSTASGDSSSDSWYPQVSATQVQSAITEVAPSNLILDGTCWLQYTVAPKTRVSIVLRYVAYPITKLIKKPRKK